MSIRQGQRSETGASLHMKHMAVGRDNGNHATLLLENMDRRASWFNDKRKRTVVRLSKVPTSRTVHFIIRFESGQYDDEVSGPRFEYGGNFHRVHPSSANDADFVTSLH